MNDFTILIFTKLTFVRRLFSGNCCAEFHENPTCGLVIETG